MSHLNISTSFISALAHRLESILPNRTGYSLAEVELNSQFTITTNLILKNCRPNKFNGYQNFFSDLLNALVAILEKLNIDPNTRKLVERSETVLSSTVILTRLLRVIAVTNWVPESMLGRNSDPSPDVVMRFDIDSSVTPNSLDLYAFPEPPAVDIDTFHVLEVLFTIFSPEINIQAVSDIRKFKSVVENVDCSVTPSSTLLQQEIRSQIMEIDSNLLILVRYIAASNPPEYSNFVRQKLFSWADRGQQIPLASLQKYGSLLMYVYCTPNNTSFYLRLVYNALAYIQSNTWKQLLLHFESMNLRTQCINKPGFYSNVIYAGSAAEQDCKIIFDYISTAFESESNSNASLFSWYVILCPSDFDELLLKLNKLKQAFNKRVKFLNYMLKESQAGMSLDSFESLIRIFLLGSLLPDAECGVRQFSCKFLDDTYHNLIKMRLKCITDLLLTRYRNLYRKLFTAAIALKPEIYVPLFIREFREKHEEDGHFMKGGFNLADSQNVLEILAALSRQSQYRDNFEVIVAEVNATLSHILHFCSDISIRNNTSLIKSRRPSEDFPAECLHGEADTDSKDSLKHSTSKVAEDQMSLIEDIFQLTLEIYTEAPQFFLQFLFENPSDSHESKVRQILAFADEVYGPIDVAIHSPTTSTKSLFKSACKLSMKLLRMGNDPVTSDEVHCISTILFRNIIHSTCEVIGFLAYPAFKGYFVFLQSFLLERIGNVPRSQNSDFYDSEWTHIGCERVCTSLDKLLMLCMCNHDIQFFSLLKLTIKAHEYELHLNHNNHSCFENSLAESFKVFMGDDLVFTGFVSLHKKFKSILADFEPTRGLYEAWVMIYDRWTEVVSDMSKLNDDNFTFKHYTEFLASTSGCFLDHRFTKCQTGSQEEATKLISSFYDKAVSLLKCDELFVRVVICEALSSETHSDVYQLIYDKLMVTLKGYKDQASLSPEAVLFIEETVSIFTSILNVRADGALLLAALFPEVIEMFFEFVNIVPNPIDQINLKLRLCKLTSVVSTQKEQIGIAGAYKIRNMIAKTAAEWLDSAVTYSLNSTKSLVPVTLITSHGRASDTEFLQIELATECAKCLALQLQGLVLSVPDGTRESNFAQAKDLAFSNFFSLFYKIFQKFNCDDPSPLVIKSKFKIQTITDHVLKAISNMLKANVGIGLQFALPLGYHGNDMIRPIFLDIFATTLSAGKLKLQEEEFSEDIIRRFSDLCEVYGAAAGVASPAEHNLLATSLHGLFGYTLGLDKLFLTLLQVELESVSRASDIFRGNSTLTRLMSIFAKEYGTPYLSVVLRPFVEEMINENIVFEVEKENNEEDVALFIKYLRKLVDNVVNSTPWVPESFRFICREIYKSVAAKFNEASLVAVGSFLFLRFFCPAIVSPELFFDLTSVNLKVKRSLMQIVKTIQYMANGSILNLKWAALANCTDVMNELNNSIFDFIGVIANDSEDLGYVFHRITLKPLTCLRYLHKFFYTYFIEIRHRFLIGSSAQLLSGLQERIKTWRRLDAIMAELGNPKPSIALQGTKSYKVMDLQSNFGNSQFAEFMAKMSAKNIETSIESPIIKNAVFHDGTPVIVLTFRHMKEISYDVSTMVYLLLESVSQISETEYYCVVDLTQFFYIGIIGNNFSSLLKTYAPRHFFANCKKTFYYNVPRASHLTFVDSLSDFRSQSNTDQTVYLYSEQDSPEIIDNLCLSETTLSIPLDVKLVCSNCKLYDEVTRQFTNVTIKLGRLWILIWFERQAFEREYTSTKTVAPVEVHKLTDLLKCEISNKSGESNEFTLFLNRFNYQVTLVTPQRQEILRFLYFAMLRSSKTRKNLRSAADELELEQSQRFSAISNLLFHGLLQKNEDVRIAASNLLRSFSSYYDISFDQSSRNFSKASFTIDMTDFVVSFSSRLATHFPQYSYEFLKAFFANFDKFTAASKVSGIMYLSPWVVNLHEHVSKEEDSTEKLAFIVRQLCKITLKNPLLLSLMKELIWKRIFEDMRMTGILVDELVAIAMELASESDDWNIVISVFQPSVELCGELVTRLHSCIAKTKKLDSEIVLQTKILEISILVKICASLFFDSHVFGSLYLLDVILFCTLFIDRSDLDFGHDLQSLVLNTIQSFAGRRNLEDRQVELIRETLEYFSGQRAKMLFGLTTKGRGAHVDFSQSYERSMSFEHLCDYLNNFIENVGTSDDRKYWVSRWSSLSKDIAFSDSFFQMRAYSVVCTLARSGISDSIGGRIMKILTSQLFDPPDSHFEGSVCLLRLMLGLANDSVYMPLLVWVVESSLLLRSPLNFQAITTALGKILERMIIDQSFADSVFAYRPNLEPLLGRYEQRVGVKFCEQNHEFVFLILIARGLTISQSRHSSISSMKGILVKKMERNKDIALLNLDETDFSFGYLLMVYLSISDSEFWDFMKEVGLGGISLTRIGRDKIPIILLEGLRSLCKRFELSLLLSAHIFSGDCEQAFKLKFISLYEKLLEVLKDTAIFVFHIIWAKMEDSFVNAASNSLTSDISALLMEVVRDKDYRADLWKKKASELLHEVSISSLDSILHSDGRNDESETFHRMRLVRQMFYQNLCSAMDGLKLERY